MAQTLYSFTGTGSGAATINITAAQLQAINTTPITLVAAPSSGQAIVVESMLFEMTATATAFTSGAAVFPVYHGATSGLLSETIPSSTVNATGPSTTYNYCSGIPPASGGFVPTTGTGIDLYSSTNFSTGTGTAKVQLWYKVITL